MAFLDATQLNDLQPTGAINEKRYAELGIINAVKQAGEGIDYLSPEVKKAYTEISAARSIKNLALVDQTVTVNTTPGYGNIPSNLPLFANYNFTVYDVFSGFRFYPAAFDNNQAEAVWTRNQVMQNVLYACANQIETILATVLSSRKTQLLNYTTQVSQGDGTFTFNATPDELEISKAAQKETMFANLQELMAANELGGMYNFVSSRAGFTVQKTEAAKYGMGNEKNLQALGMPTPDRIHQSGNISAGSDIFNGYMIRDGAIGVIENFPHNFRNGVTIDSKRWTVSDVELPFARMRANVFTDSNPVDGQSLVSASPNTDSNLIMTHFEEMAIWFRFYVPFRYNSDLSTRANDIVKISGKTS